MNLKYEETFIVPDEGKYTREDLEKRFISNFLNDLSLDQLKKITHLRTYTKEELISLIDEILQNDDIARSARRAHINHYEYLLSKLNNNIENSHSVIATGNIFV